MKETKDRSLEFVLHYYQAGKFDTKKAIRKAMPARVIPLWRKIAVAASLTLLLIGGAYATYMAADLGTTEKPREEMPATQQSSPATHFHFDNTPLNEVLLSLGEHYGVTLTAEETDKRLTADFDSDNLDETISMIEQVLDIKISVRRK